MEQQDMQKRLMIFFAAAALLLISFSLVSQYFFKDNAQNEKNQTQQTEKEAAAPIKQVGGSYDLVLTGERVNTDNLKDLVRIKTKEGYVEFSNIGGRIVSAFDNRYNIDIVPEFSKSNKIFPGEIITTDTNITKLLNFSKYESKIKDNKISFYLKNENVEVEKTYTINDDNTITVDIKTKGLENVGLSYLTGVTLKSEGDFGHDGPIIKTDREIIRIDNDINTIQTIRDKILWAGQENKYFMQILSVKGGINTVYIVPVAKDTTVVLSEIPASFEGFNYLGPKLYSLLGEITDKYQKLWNVDLDLRSSIDFGFFGILGKPLFLLLHFIYDFVHNWGLAIIVLTVLLRIVLFPLNHKSLKAMKKMADLAPEMEKLKKKYAKDPQKLREEIMKLYAEAGANPMSGCLPILAQIPIFIALYNVLMVTVELKNAPFMLWIKDLSDKDPYYVLPILMGLSMVVQQFITPISDKNQRMIMYILAGVFTFMFMNFPSGLVLYWLTNNILGLIQSVIVNKSMKK